MKTFKQFVSEMDYRSTDPQSKNIVDRRNEPPDRKVDLIGDLIHAAQPRPRRTEVSDSEFKANTKDVSKQFKSATRPVSGVGRFSEPNIGN